LINTRRDGDSTGIALSGELDLRSTDELDGVIRSAEERDVGRIVVDLSDVSFIDSTGLSVLLGAKKRSDGQLIFIPSKHDAVRRLLELTGTVAMFD
jgi:stage II sporulation protein AA (anti-sigma F factor antagonist)